MNMSSLRTKRFVFQSSDGNLFRTAIPFLLHSVKFVSVREWTCVIEDDWRMSNNWCAFVSSYLPSEGKRSKHLVTLKSRVVQAKHVKQMRKKISNFTRCFKKHFCKFALNSLTAPLYSMCCECHFSEMIWCC